jgi:transcriptional regulator with XRE-family HTH domain
MSDERTPARGRLREHVAEEIRVILARKRMSGAELARRTGIKQSTISRRMTGETAFDMDDLEIIAEVLEVDVADLMPRMARAGNEPNVRLSKISRTADRRAAAAATSRPIGSKQRSAVRPPSGVPVGKRRPTRVRPGERRIPA